MVFMLTKCSDFAMLPNHLSNSSPPRPTRGGESFSVLDRLDLGGAIDLDELVSSLQQGDDPIAATAFDHIIFPRSVPRPMAGAIVPAMQPPTSFPVVQFSGSGRGETGDWTSIQLFVQRHEVHRVENAQLPELKEYLVSNLKRFAVEVILRDRTTRQAVHRHLRVKASLLYENAQPVQPTTDAPLLSGDTHITIVNGSGEFKLQMGKGVLSQSHQRQRFRIRIEPEDAELTAAFPCLTALTEPLKSVTKLRFKPGAAAAVAAPAQFAAQFPAQFPVQPLARPAAPPVAPHLPYYGDASRATPQQQQPGGLPSEASPPPLPQSASGEQAGALAANGVQVFLQEGALAAVARSLQREELHRLEAHRAASTVELTKTESVLAQQRDIIAQMERQNRELLDELARVRQEQEQEGAG